MLALTAVHAESVKTLPAPTGYIDDYAQVLTPDARAELEGVCRDLHMQTRAQLFLVTVHTLGSESRDQYANDLFHAWKIGEKKTDRGVLILLAIDDHQRRIEVGYGLEGVLNDAKAGDIGREMVPQLKLGNYDEAARIEVDEIARIVAEDSHVTLDSLNPPPASVPAAAPAMAVPVSSGSGDAAVFFLILGLFVVVMAVLIVWARRSRGGYYTGNGGTYITPTYDPGQPYSPTRNSGNETGLFSSFSNTSSSSFDTGSSSGGGLGATLGGVARGGIGRRFLVAPRSRFLGCAAAWNENLRFPIRYQRFSARMRSSPLGRSVIFS